MPGDYPTAGATPSDPEGRQGDALVILPPAVRPVDWREGLPLLRTPVATLREPRLADASSLFEHLATDRVARFMARPPGQASGFQRFIQWMVGERQLGRCMCFAIVPAGREEAVGLIQVRQLEPGFGSAEWGFALGERFWGTGIFRAASVAAVDFVFRYAGAYRLEARSTTDNDRSNGALRRLGATPEGILRKSLVGGPRPMDQLLWSMHADEWLRTQRTPPYELRPLEPPADGTAAPAAPAAPKAIAPWRRELPTFSSTLCTLRELELSDAAHLVPLLNDADVLRFIPPSPASIEAFEQFILWAQGQRRAGRYACFAVVPHARPQPVGIFQLRQLDPSFKTAEWGFVLAKRYWGSGLFLSAAIPVLDFAFEIVGVHRLEARAASANGRGNGALRKVGAALEGQLRRSFLLGGIYHDDALWALLAEDWRRLRAHLNGADSNSSINPR
jgi:RimJ/RimL family protein N-acetyltransferase